MFNRIKYILAFLLVSLLVSAGSCSREEKIAVKSSSSMACIVMENSTALRINPFVFAGCITRMDKSTVAVVMERSSEKTQIGKSRDYWYHVRLVDGITGWVYGGNIKIFDADDSGKLNEMLGRLQKDGQDEVAKSISGKWWSVNAAGDFTAMCLELYPDGRFRAFRKGAEDSAAEGLFTVDSSRNELLFSPDSGCFGEKLKYQRRGEGFSMAVPGPAGVKFKRIHKIIEAAPEPAAQNSESEKKKDGMTAEKKTAPAGEQNISAGQKEE